MTEITDFSPTDALNTAISGESLEGNTANMGRMEETLQAIIGAVGRWTSSDTIASASTTDIGGQPEAYLTVSGTTTITAFGTIRAGTVRYLMFSGALTLTHNATSLILPGAANITTAAGDTAAFVSEGSGNWRCLGYQRAATVPVRSQAWDLIASTTTGSVSSVIITDLSAYVQLRLSGKIFTASDGVNIQLRTSTDNGATFPALGGDYVAQLQNTSGATTTSAVSAAGTGHFLTYLNGVGNGTNEAISFEALITDFNKNQLAFFQSHSFFVDESGNLNTSFNAGTRSLATARNALQIIASSGNITAQYTLEGVRG